MINMSNNLENKNSKVEKVYYDQNNIEGEMLRYRANSSSYKYGMLAIVFSILAAFISLNSIKWNVDVIFKILLNIILLLFGFLSIEKAKAYSKKYSYVLIAFGAVCIGRIFWYPLILINDYRFYLANNKADGFEGRLGPTITSKNPHSNAYLPASGYTRATIAIVLLSLAAVCFLVSGIIGYVKAKKYEKYMQGKDVSKGV